MTKANFGSDVKGNGGRIFHVRGIKGNLLCIWRITVDPDKRVQLWVKTCLFLRPEAWIRVLDGNTCSADEMLFIPSDDREVRTFEFISTSNTIMLVSGSMSAQPDDLFKAAYTIITNNNTECNKIITGTNNGTILSSAFPQEYRSSAFCNYLCSYSSRITQRAHLAPLTEAYRATEYLSSSGANTTQMPQPSTMRVQVTQQTHVAPLTEVNRAKVYWSSADNITMQTLQLSTIYAASILLKPGIIAGICPLVTAIVVLAAWS
ncbi:unnamed protein product [Dicrocoelium dendriticum]|nr:unnamed protein product [Dicrocoelium dendriticum]